MARKRKGNRIDGWLVVDKPAGVTSAGVVNKLRWVLGAQKAGHSGTLDPGATGCLAVAFGEATKLIPVAQGGPKSYQFTLRWGMATSTDDRAGEVIAEASHRPTEAQIRAALPAFRGEICQVPPQVSAVKVAGARAYDLARTGEALELAARPLTVHALELRACPDPDHASFDFTCARGGYVRAIARDLGEALGTLAHVTTLRRLATGPFGLADAWPGDPMGLQKGETLPLFAPAAGLRGQPYLTVSEAQAADLRQGRAIPTETPAIWASHNGQPVALGAVREGFFHPSRVLAPPPDDHPR
ncbi:MAG: tRNA pseudouridine(55) synthase TruB [Pseudomonadota bacterium]